MDFNTASRQREGEGEEAGELCVLSKHVEHLSLLFYKNEKKKKDKLFAPLPFLLSLSLSFYLSVSLSFSPSILLSADSAAATAASTLDKLFVMLINDKSKSINNIDYLFHLFTC